MGRPIYAASSDGNHGVLFPKADRTYELKVRWGELHEA